MMLYLIIDYDVIFNNIENTIDTPSTPNNQTEKNGQDTNSRYNEQSIAPVQEGNSYRNRLRRTIQKPDRYGYN